MATYGISLKDNAGNEIASDIVDGLKAAKVRASYFLSDMYARNGDTSHAALGTYKVEVISNGVCVWDRFLL